MQLAFLVLNNNTVNLKKSTLQNFERLYNLEEIRANGIQDPKFQLRLSPSTLLQRSSLHTTLSISAASYLSMYDSDRIATAARQTLTAFSVATQ